MIAGHLQTSVSFWFLSNRRHSAIHLRPTESSSSAIAGGRGDPRQALSGKGWSKDVARYEIMDNYMTCTIGEIENYQSYRMMRSLTCYFSGALSAPYVKVYLVKGRKCIAKAKTSISRRTLDPLYQQQLIFNENYQGCILQVIVADFRT